MVRVRGLNERETRDGAKSCILLDDQRPNTIILDSKPDQKIFNFDYVGGTTIT
jgi:hypothetical protein